MHPNAISRTPSRTIIVVSLWTYRAFAPCGLVGPLSSCGLNRNFTKVVPYFRKTLTFLFYDFDTKQKKIHASVFCFSLIYVGYLLILLIFTPPSRCVDSVRRCCVVSVYHTIYRSAQTFTTQFTQIFRISGELVQYSTTMLHR